MNSPLGWASRMTTTTTMQTKEVMALCAQRMQATELLLKQVVGLIAFEDGPKKAIEAGNEKQAQWLYSEWVKTGERLRALEKTAPKALEELGIYVRRDEVTRELVPLHVAHLRHRDG